MLRRIYLQEDKELITVSKAAKEKYCSQAYIHYCIKTGVLNSVKKYDKILVVVDEKYKIFCKKRDAKRNGQECVNFQPIIIDEKAVLEIEKEVGKEITERILKRIMEKKMEGS